MDDTLNQSGKIPSYIRFLVEQIRELIFLLLWNPVGSLDFLAYVPVPRFGRVERIPLIHLTFNLSRGFPFFKLRYISLRSTLYDGIFFFYNVKYRNITT